MLICDQKEKPRSNTRSCLRLHTLNMGKVSGSFEEGQLAAYLLSSICDADQAATLH